MGEPPMLKKRQSTFEPPEGKLHADAFDLLFVPSGCLWVIAVDGSDLSMRALRLAAFLMNPTFIKSGQRDQVVVVNIVQQGEAENTNLLVTCREELRKCNLQNVEKQVALKTITLPEGWSVGDGLVYFTNHVHMGQTHLVIGAAGKRADGSGFSHLGSIAEQCLAKVKVPVTVVKGPWGTTSHGDRGPFGRPLRHGMDASTGLQIVVCIDGSRTGDLAFDAGTSFCREGDTLTALHVESVDSTDSLCEKKYPVECEKVLESKKLAACKYVHVPSKRNSISDAIIAASDEADILVMGTVELVNIKKRNVLGSIALHIAKKAKGHLTVIKNFPC